MRERVSLNSEFAVLADLMPDVILEIRYYSGFNFVGTRIEGYEEPIAILTKKAAYALKQAGDEVMVQGYRLKVFDAYRPQRAVDHFVRWAADPDDDRMKPYFYPAVEKERLIPEGYIAAHSGHSRGSTVDLTLFDMKTGRDVDMGSPFDLFGQSSSYGWPGVSGPQKEHRQYLRDVMTRHGFVPLDGEWWHFTLKDEPFPDAYFDFPVCREALKTGGII